MNFLQENSLTEVLASVSASGSVAVYFRSSLRGVKNTYISYRNISIFHSSQRRMVDCNAKARRDEFAEQIRYENL